MVQVRELWPLNDEGIVDIEQWLDRLTLGSNPKARQVLHRACVLSQACEAVAIASDRIWSKGSSSFLTGLEMAEILDELHLDETTLVAAILYRSVREEKIPLVSVQEQFGETVATLIEGVQQMANITQHNNEESQLVLGQPETQTDKIRKMLVTIIDDVRVPLIKLAERTCAIRAVKDNQHKRYKVAREVADIYAPLAHRLGIGHIKWELEDLAFRYLHSNDYKRIAKLLGDRRIAREEYIQAVVTLLQQQIEDIGIEGEVFGRAKHIYSIWRKMKKKNISFEQVYDVRAVRILVPSIQDCYSVLGIVHSQWPTIPNEFDDYIANPKENGYRSLHTAVVGPEGKVLEIQIRTYTMHEEAEFGVCAHWQYKGADGAAGNQGYEKKLEWLRQVLEWHDDMGESNFAEHLTHDVSQDRIYVFTPKGHVVDLTAGATPIDFAYQIHTEVGHRCRGAKVNGRIVPLTYTLQMGDQVTVITGKDIEPNREWLRTSLEYIKTSKAKAKVRAWFKQQDKSKNSLTGKKLLDKELSRLALNTLDYKAIAQELSFETLDDLYAAVGSGDLGVRQVLKVAQGASTIAETEQFELVPSQEKVTNPEAHSDFYFSGVGNLLAKTANCCKPLPGDSIVGYVTVSRGVSVHRDDCSNLLQLQQQEPERIISVDWVQSNNKQSTYPVDLIVDAYDRPGLLKDISTILANANINVTYSSTRTSAEDSTATMYLTVEIHGLDELVVVLKSINQLPNVIQVMRQKVL